MRSSNTFLICHKIFEEFLGHFNDRSDLFGLNAGEQLSMVLLW